jgi:hypothetical protein
LEGKVYGEPPLPLLLNPVENPCILEALFAELLGLLLVCLYCPLIYDAEVVEEVS